MGKLLGGFFGIIFGAVFILAVVSAGPGIYWWDRHFTGYSVGFTIPRILVAGPWPIHLFSIPPGIAIKDADAISHADLLLSQAVGNERRLTASLNAQSARVRLQAADTASALSKAETDGVALRKATAKAQTAETRLVALGNKTPQTPDACTRAEAVMAAFNGGLQ